MTKSLCCSLKVPRDQVCCDEAPGLCKLGRMAAMAEAPSVHTSMHAAIGHDDGIHSATVLSSSNAAMDDDQVDPMEVSPSTHVPMGPPNGTATSARNIPAPVFSPAATGAAAAVQQPKVVQTAFIHKLYKYEFHTHSILKSLD